MSRKILLLSVLVILILISGCTHYEQKGVVKHNNSLEEAYEKCNELCEKEDCVISDTRGKCLAKLGSHRTELTKCTEKECICGCG